MRVVVTDPIEVIGFIVQRFEQADANGGTVWIDGLQAATDDGNLMFDEAESSAVGGFVIHVHAALGVSPYTVAYGTITDVRIGPRVD